MRLREEQSGGLRRGYVATRLCEELKQQGAEGAFDAGTGVLRATDQMGRTSRLKLDLDGYPESLTTPVGRLSRFRYDDALLTDLIEPSGRHTALTIDEKRAPLTFARNGVELARFAWNEDYTHNTIQFWDGTRASGTYSASGKPLRLTDRTNATESFEYDERNRLTRLVDGGGNDVQFSYDAEGRPSTTRYADGRAETVEYDDNGRWVGTLLNGERVFEREGDDGHRPLSVAYADSQKNTFAYDDQGRLVSATGPEGSLSFEYDSAGKPSADASDDARFELEHDKSGLLTAIAYPDGLRAEYRYDDDKRLVQVDWGGAIISFTHDRQDREVWTYFPNNLATVKQLAPSGKLERATTTDRRTNVACFDTQYRYDAQDRLSALNDTTLGVRQYVYDGESQLLGVANADGAWRETFTYDGAGNRTSSSGQSVAVDSGNRLLAQGDVTCDYDSRGNLVRMTDQVGAWFFKYDSKNQLTEAHGPCGVVTFKYDAIGRRIEKKSATRTVRYAWCGEGLAREVITTAEGESIREYLYRPGRYEPLAMRIDGRCYFYHNDHQGTPQRITDAQGKIAWSADCFAFGYAQLANCSIENPLRFAGQYADPETGLHYNRFRYYSPVIGRYLSIDPLRLLAGNNLYLYVRNNPINKLDGLGLWSVLGVVGAVAAAAAVVVAAPFILAAAPIVVAEGLLLAGAISVGRDFCVGCFLEGAAEAFFPGLAMGALGALVLGGVAFFFGAPVAAVVGVAAGCIFAYQMLDQYFGWSGGTPFEELSPDDKSRAMGQLFGGTVGAILGGLGVGKLLTGPKTVPVEETPGTRKGGGGKGTEGETSKTPGEEAPKELPKDEVSKQETPEQRKARERQAQEENKARKKKIRELDKKSKNGDKAATRELNEMKAREAREAGNTGAAEGHEAENRVVDELGDDCLEAGRKVKYPNPNDPNKPFESDIDAETTQEVIQVKSGTEVPSENQTQATRLRAAETGKQPKLIYDPAKMSERDLAQFKADNPDFITEPKNLH